MALTLTGDGPGNPPEPTNPWVYDSNAACADNQQITAGELSLKTEFNCILNTILVLTQNDYMKRLFFNI